MKKQDDLKSNLQSWLAAEARIEAEARSAGAASEAGESHRHGEDDRLAEAALSQLFEALPQPEPRPDFTRRVLLEAGLIRPPGYQTWLRRYAAAVVLVVLGLMLVTLPMLWQVWSSSGGANGILGSLAGLLAVGLHGMSELWTLMDRLLRFGRAMWLVAVSPTTLTALCMLIGLAVASMRGLLALLSEDRSTEYVRTA